MREILFRGKDFSGVINHNWCFGSLDTIEDDRAIIIYSDRSGNKCRIFVDPSTVGQYTGLTDKNGTKIFEGDIVTTKFNERNKPYAIIYDEELATFIGRDKDNFNFTTLSGLDNSLIEIIGNIHDNPELLRSEE